MSETPPLSPIIARIVRSLNRHPEVKYLVTETTLKVPAAIGGFSVQCQIINKGAEVRYGGWRHNFKDEEETTRCFMYGLCERCRLRVLAVGDSDRRWTLESLVDGKWVEDSSSGSKLYPFWLKRSERYLQNRWIS